jgi:hypothetical protein
MGILVQQQEPCRRGRHSQEASIYVGPSGMLVSLSAGRSGQPSGMRFASAKPVARTADLGECMIADARFEPF